MSTSLGGSGVGRVGGGGGGGGNGVQDLAKQGEY